VTADDFRRIALGMKGAVEQAHMGHPDFRVNGRIFATLHADLRSGMAVLTSEQQRDVIRDAPHAFRPENGAWGLRGYTAVRLDAIGEDELGEALTLAWRGAAAKGKARRTKAAGVPKPRTPSTIDDYLAGVSEHQRAALEKLRRTIKAAVPRAEECISYGVPAFRLDGRMLVFFAAARKHCSFFPGAHPIDVLKDELTGYSTSKGTVRFDPSKPLPATLVRRLLRARMSEQAHSTRTGVARTRRNRTT